MNYSLIKIGDVVFVQLEPIKIDKWVEKTNKEVVENERKQEQV